MGGVFLALGMGYLGVMGCTKYVYARVLHDGGISDGTQDGSLVFSR